MSMNTEFDVVVIGGGPGGYVCAIRCAQLGFKVACVEERKAYGGTCLNVGCIPSKALLESSHHYAHLSHGIEEHGIELGKPKLNLKKMLERKDDVVGQNTKGVAFLLQKNKIAPIHGRGKIVASDTVAVKTAEGDQVLKAKHIVIATGSTPVALKSLPFDHETIVDSEDALKFSAVPEHLVVIGGGVIGLELGSVWSRLGAKVTVVEANAQILGATDQNVAQNMKRLLEKQGITIHLNAMLQGLKQPIEKKKGKSLATLLVKNALDEKAAPMELVCDKVLVAVGRRAYTDELFADGITVQRDDRGRIVTDDHFATNVKGIYAIGDVIAGPMLAHKAEEDGVALAEMLAGKPGHVNYHTVPSIVYTWPEVASVGYTEQECKAKNFSYNKGQFQFKANGRAKAMGQTDGFVTVLADKQTDRLLGVHIIGPSASELIAEAVVLMEFCGSSEDLARIVHGHPTLSESVKEAALACQGRPIHS